MDKLRNKIIQGDSLEVLKTLPDESIDMVITSPPYWNLRDYGVEGQLGLEPTFNEYINKLCDIFDEVKRVLKKEGTCWVNLGDTYGTQSGQSRGKTYKSDKTYLKNVATGESLIKPQGYHKCLLQIPSRFSIEMINRGWILRNSIIWMKPNCMPSSVNDRFTIDYEMLYFFVKDKKYYFEQQFEPLKEVSKKRLESGWDGNIPDKKVSWQGIKKYLGKSKEEIENIKGRNKRSVWTITTKSYPEAHFATYPPKLIETPILAGCPELVCKKCGKAREKIEEYIEKPKSTGTGKDRYKEYTEKGMLGGEGGTSHTVPKGSVYATPKELIGYTDCGCNVGFEKGIVLYIFMGSGTTAEVARDLDRDYLGIELNESYIELIKKRLKQDKLL